MSSVSQDSGARSQKPEGRRQTSETRVQNICIPSSVFCVLSSVFCLLFSVFFLAGCKNRNIHRGQAEIAVTNSYLQCVVNDLCPDAEVLCLAPPGMCPGHFDILPSQVTLLRKCRMLLLFDIQERIEDSLSRMKDDGLRVYSVKTSPGLCVPENYVATSRGVCDILCSEYPERAAQYRQRLQLIEQRLEHTGAELQASIRQVGAASAEVITSDHQAQFADWLGLETIATFVGSDIETVSNINHCLKRADGRDVRFVIANKQEGTALAEALADRLGAKAVVFSNFPAVDSAGHAFDQLLRQNVRLLVEAATQ
jgi:zinc transport system substrate-binding protein